MSEPHGKRILVLGAGGLIGSFVASDLARRGFAVTAAARYFTSAQRAAFAFAEIEAMPLATAALGKLIDTVRPDVIVNCVGVLQSTPRATVEEAHATFVDALMAALQRQPQPILLVQVSIPGSDGDDRTEFSRTKRVADRAIMASGLPYAILRPGFVVAPAAYGGSALVRALAALPFDLPPSIGERPLQMVAVEDIAETVAVVSSRVAQARDCAAVWDLVHPDPLTVAKVIVKLRRWLGAQRRGLVILPDWLLEVGASAADATALLGWRPPIRSTALDELRRGVAGDPGAWIAATGIEPRALDDALAQRPATVQERWFARLYLLKPLAIGGLVVFWIVSGLIALTVAFEEAVAILTKHGFPDALARAITIGSSVMDIAIGAAIALRRSCRIGLMAGIAVSLFYMTVAAMLTPDLWIEPLGALVKTGPAIVLMLVSLAILDDR